MQLLTYQQAYPQYEKLSQIKIVKNNFLFAYSENCWAFLIDFRILSYLNNLQLRKGVVNIIKK